MTKRLVFVDFIRGMMIFYMVVLHAFLFRVVHQYKPLFEDIMTTSPLIARIVAAPFIFFSLWGSLFCMLTGIVFMYKVRTTFEKRKNTNPVFYFLRRGLSGMLLIAIQYIWLTFLSPKSTEHPGNPTYSLLTGTLEQWGFSSFNFLHYSTTGMIESIGWTVVVLSITGYFVYRKQGSRNLRFYMYFGALFLIMTGISVCLELWIKDPSEYFDGLYDNNKIFQVIILLKLTGNRFSFFPLVVFGITGAIIGYNLNKRKNDSLLLVVLFSVGVCLIIIYLIIWYLGFNMLTAYTSTYIPLPLHLLNLGSQCVFIAFFNLIFRKYQYTSRERDIGIVRFLNMYSVTSLTVYFFEPLTSILIYLCVQNLYHRPISEEFFVWTGFLLLNGLLWYGILVVWRRKQYKGSIEWFIGNLKDKLKGYSKSSL